MVSGDLKRLKRRSAVRVSHANEAMSDLYARRRMENMKASQRATAASRAKSAAALAEKGFVIGDRVTNGKTTGTITSIRRNGHVITVKTRSGMIDCTAVVLTKVE